MTIESWMREALPVPADSPEAQRDPESHSLRKWEALHPSVLKRHGIVRVGRVLWDKDRVRHEVCSIDCALCVKYNIGQVDPCHRCPLYLARNFVRCDEHSFRSQSPWGAFLSSGSVRPMISLLKRVIDLPPRVYYQSWQREKRRWAYSISPGDPPWMTRREVMAEAKRDGVRAVFRK